jgi:hypothetical protein
MAILSASLPGWVEVFQRILLFSGCLTLLFSPFVIAAPGAHGPDGQHLDNAAQPRGASNPGFESFTETFEVMGELTNKQLVLYLHDFRTNAPVADASIELESDSHSVLAEYSAENQHYVATDEQMLKALQKPGEHHLVLTIVTENAGDLLSAVLVMPNQEHGPVSEHEHEHHFPWWIVILSAVLLALGFLIGRYSGGKQ